ncbi:MAG: hypothetical protein D6E12_18235 [Desulfovibrio sp.]|nr:MAG: hypothetical protein D6E12_18235 [Desulfovibrio sp.]
MVLYEPFGASGTKATPAGDLFPITPNDAEIRPDLNTQLLCNLQAFFLFLLCNTLHKMQLASFYFEFFTITRRQDPIITLAFPGIEMNE